VLLARSAVAATIAISLASHADAVEIERSAELNANPATAWRALTDYERYVDFIPDLQPTLPHPGDKHITGRSAQFGHMESAGHEQRTHWMPKTLSVPAQVREFWRSPDGSIVRIRAIESTDATLIREFVGSLSFETRYLRFMGTVKELSSQAIDRLTRVDHRREAALVAVVNYDGADRIVGVARYAMNADDETCDFAIVVADNWQRRGLGSRLLTLLVDTASARGLKRVGGEVLAINRPMTAFVSAHGFSVTLSESDPRSLRVERRLDGSRSDRRATNVSMA
jgi:GNAT superfamily N-acetyltransferase